MPLTDESLIPQFDVGLKYTAMPNIYLEVAAAVPAPVLDILGTLWDAGFAAYVVGGSIRDIVLGREPADWDLATDARPERLQEVFPGAMYENRFGTVAVRASDDSVIEVTTFRTDHDYADHRRPPPCRHGHDRKHRRRRACAAGRCRSAAAARRPTASSGRREPAARPRRCCMPRDRVCT